MNVFRILGDLSHLLAMVLLLGKMWRSRCCAGEGAARGASAGVRPSPGSAPRRASGTRHRTPWRRRRGVGSPQFPLLIRRGE